MARSLIRSATLVTEVVPCGGRLNFFQEPVFTTVPPTTVSEYFNSLEIFNPLGSSILDEYDFSMPRLGFLPCRVLFLYCLEAV